MSQGKVINPQPRKASHHLRSLITRAYYGGSGRGYILDNIAKVDELYFSEREAIEKYSKDRRREILRHAANTVPFYRDYFRESGTDETDRYESLEHWPILTKAIIRREQGRLFSEQPGPNPFFNTSGGSTGEPVRILQDKAMTRAARTFELLFMRWAKYAIGQPHCLIWGVPPDTLGQSISFHERVFRVVNNETYLNCYRIDDRLLQRWVETINHRRPALIEAYVDAIVLLCEFVRSSGREIWTPNGIITSAGVLTSERRRLIEQVFGCPVINRYGSREVNNVACSCSESASLHVNEAMCEIEVSDPDGRPCRRGVEGDLLITLFINRSMPLIRYRIEDRGVMAKEHSCECGRNTKKLIEVSGRRNDYLIGGDGAKVNGTALTTLLYSIEGMKAFQYRQSEIGKVTLTVVALDNDKLRDLERALSVPVRHLEDMLKGTTVTLEFSEEILPSASGKYRYVINEIL